MEFIPNQPKKKQKKKLIGTQITPNDPKKEYTSLVDAVVKHVDALAAEFRRQREAKQLTFEFGENEEVTG